MIFKGKTPKGIAEMLEKAGTQVFSEKALLDVADWHYKRGDCYCFLTGGDIDSLTFLKHVIRQQPLRYCLVSTWCFGVEDAREIGGRDGVHELPPSFLNTQNLLAR